MRKPRQETTAFLLLHVRVQRLNQAIANAKAKDSQPGEQHYFPALKETKVYELGEALMARIGKNGWLDFINSK